MLTKMKLILIITITTVALSACKNTSEPSEAQLAYPNLQSADSDKFDEMLVSPAFKKATAKLINLRDVQINLSALRGEFSIPEKAQLGIKKAFLDILKEEFAKSSYFTMVEETQANVTLNITINDIDLAVPDDIRRSSTRVFSDEPIKMTFSGTLNNTKSDDTLIYFQDTQSPQSIVFEEITKSSVSFDLKRIMRRWARDIRSGLEAS
jgi:hypothetical protein